VTGFKLGFPIKYQIPLLSYATEPLFYYTTKPVLLIQGSWLFYKGTSTRIAEKFKFPGQICQKDYVWFVTAFFNRLLTAHGNFNHAGWGIAIGRFGSGQVGWRNPDYRAVRGNGFGNACSS